jgi:hypothetical protein
MGAMTCLNLADNKLTDYGNDMSGVVAIADVIPGMGALSVLSLKDNTLATKEGGKALAQALANSSTLKELDVSSNDWEDMLGNRLGDGPGFAQELAVGIKDNGAISKLIFGGDKYNAKEGRFDHDKWITPEPVTLEVGMTEADFSNKNLGAGGAIIISAWITHKDKGAMTKFDISDMGAILQFTFSGDRSDSKPVTMETSMTEADFSGKGLGLSGAIMLSAFLPKCT